MGAGRESYLNLNDGTDFAMCQGFAYGYELKASDLLILKRANHQFKGWYTTENCASGTEFTSMTLNGEITLYAKWEKLPKLYDVTFQAVGTNANDVENTKAFASQEITADLQFAFEPAEQAETLEDDTSCGRYVMGYYADKEGTVAFDFSQEITKNTTVYVKWADKVKVTIQNKHNSATCSVTVDGNAVTATEFYVMSGADISVSATIKSSLFSSNKVTISDGITDVKESAAASLLGTTKTATLTFTADKNVTVTITKA